MEERTGICPVGTLSLWYGFRTVGEFRQSGTCQTSSGSGLCVRRDFTADADQGTGAPCHRGGNPQGSGCTCREKYPA